MNKSTYHVPAMDCPSEEQMIRMKLADMPNIKELRFDIPGRKLEVVHDSQPEPISEALASLNLGAQLVDSEAIEWQASDSTQMQHKALWIILLINFALFVVEFTTGWLSSSMGLVADSLDMLADAMVYGLSLYAVGSHLVRKKKIAKISGYFQFTLAIMGFAEVLRRFLGAGDLPEFQTMIYISLLALAGNVASLLILQKAKSDEVHMQASMIFTSNDIIANLGVIAAAGLVYWSGSKLPDLVIGALVFALVARGAFRILRLAK